MNKIKQIIKLIKKYDNISLFFHEYPDFDALGSCFGLKAFINKKYPEKHVHVVGINEIDKEVTKKFIKFNEQNVDDQFISKSLGIICDVATESRVYTQKHKLCKKTIRIDHHPHVDTFANVE
jgi:phosphoesterase RecJ-like protein